MTLLPSARVSLGAETFTNCGTNQLLRSKTSVNPASTGEPMSTPVAEVRASASPWPPALRSASLSFTGAAVTYTVSSGGRVSTTL